MKKIGLYLTCQAMLIEEAFKLINEEVELVIAYNWIQIQNNEPLPKAFDEVDIFIYQPLYLPHCPDFLKPEHLIQHRLKSNVQSIAVPYLYWLGTFPWAYEGLTKPHLSEYANSWFSKDQDIIDLTLWDANKEAEIIEISEKSFSILLEKENDTDIRGITQFIRDNYKKYPLFYTPNHPRGRLALFFVNQVLNLIGFRELSPEHEERMDRVLNTEKLPLSPQVKKTLGIEYEDDSCYFKDTVLRQTQDYILEWVMSPQQ